MNGIIIGESSEEASGFGFVPSFFVAVVVDDVELTSLIVVLSNFPKATFASDAVSAATEFDFQLVDHLSCFVVEKSRLVEFHWFCLIY